MANQPRAKKRKLDPYSLQQKALEETRKKREQQMLQQKQKMQQRLKQLITLEPLTLNKKRQIEFINFIVDSGKPVEDKITINSDPDTKMYILAFKLYQMLQKMNRIQKNRYYRSD
eukprot:243655_1